MGGRIIFLKKPKQQPVLKRSNGGSGALRSKSMTFGWLEGQPGSSRHYGRDQLGQTLVTSDSYVAPNRLPRPTSQTASPSGRTHPDRDRRADLRQADPWSDISFYAGSRQRLTKPNGTSMGMAHGFEYGMGAGPSGAMEEFSARLPHSQAWIPNQAWLESLRYNPQMDTLGSFSGKTHGPRAPNHLEDAVRIRVGAAPSDPEWMPNQLPHVWAPNAISEGMARRLDETIHSLLSSRQQSCRVKDRTDPNEVDRLTILAKPKQRENQAARHLHDWELKNREPDFRHTPAGDSRRKDSCRPIPKRRPKSTTARASSKGSSRKSSDGVSNLFKPLWQLYGEMPFGRREEKEVRL